MGQQYLESYPKPFRENADESTDSLALDRKASTKLTREGASITKHMLQNYLISVAYGMISILPMSYVNKDFYLPNAMGLRFQQSFLVC